MSEAVHFSPQIGRLLDKLETLESPVLQVWGWPGSGRSALLEALLQRQGRRALALPLAALEGEIPLRETLAAAHGEGVRWLVAVGSPPTERLEAAESWLRAGQRLVFADGRRRRSRIPMDLIPPQELLLSESEVESLWRLLTGQDLSPEAARDLRDATDGWHRPLRLALEATGGMGLEEMEPEAFLEVPAVRLFLRHEILDTFPEEERGLLLAAPEERPAKGDAAWRLLDERGLWVEGTEEDRLPRLLTAFLQRERRRRRMPERRRIAPMAAPIPATATAAGQPVYFLGLLGNPVARRRDEDGERDLDCRLRRSFQVLAFLASSPGFEAGREALIEAVWPTEGERTIERNFHPTLSHLRRALEGEHKGREDPVPLLFRGGVYRLNPEIQWEVDALDFARLGEEGQEANDRNDAEAAAAAWERAWKLYRGPFLQGYYEGWVTARREACQRLYLDILRDLGNLYVRRGRTEEAMDAYRTVLVEDPLHEGIHLAVMRLYARQGRRDLVRRQYDKLARLLLEELGVSPQGDTTLEYQRLME